MCFTFSLNADVECGQFGHDLLLVFLSMRETAVASLIFAVLDEAAEKTEKIILFNIIYDLASVT